MDTPKATGASDVGSHDRGPTDAGTEDESDWKSATLGMPGALELFGTSGPAGDTAHTNVAASTPPPSTGQRLSAKVTGAATYELETANALASPLVKDDADQKRSAYGSRDVLGERVCVTVCDGLTVSVGVVVRVAVDETLEV